MCNASRVSFKGFRQRYNAGMKSWPAELKKANEVGEFFISDAAQVAAFTFLLLLSPYADIIAG